MPGAFFMDNVSRINEVLSKIASMPPEDLLLFISRERTLTNENKAILTQIASIKYMSRMRIQETASRPEEAVLESFARKFKLNENYMETFLLVIQAYSDGQISKKLGVKLNTIHNRVKRILVKTGKYRRYELMAMAYEYGLPLKHQT